MIQNDSFPKGLFLARNYFEKGRQSEKIIEKGRNSSNSYWNSYDDFSHRADAFQNVIREGWNPRR